MSSLAQPVTSSTDEDIGAPPADVGPAGAVGLGGGGVQTARRTALVVLGMHRSGTSALTRVISLLGAQLPHHLLPPHEANKLGFWEPAQVVELHDRVFGEAGSSWDDPIPLDDAFFASDLARRFRRDLRDVLEREFGNSPLFVIKDPRACKVVPLWRDVLAEMGVDASWVLVNRNPLEVHASLHARDRFSVHKSMLLWLGHVLSAERHTRGQRRVAVSFEALLRDWQTQMRRVGGQLGLTWDDSAKQSRDEIAAFLQQDQRHHRFDDAALLARADVPSWVKQAHLAMERLCVDDLSAVSALDELDEAFAEAVDAMGPLHRLQQAETAAVRDQLGATQKSLDEARAAVNHLRRSAASGVDAGDAALRIELASRDLRMAELAGEVGARRAAAEEMGRQAREFEQRVARLTVELRAAEQRAATAEQARDSVSGTLDALHAELRSVGDLRRQIGSLEAQLDEARAQADSLAGRLAEASARLDASGRAAGAAQQRADEAESMIRELRWTVSRMSADMRTLRQEAAQLRHTVAQREGALGQSAALHRTRDQLTRKLGSSLIKLHRQHARRRASVLSMLIGAASANPLRGLSMARQEALVRASGLVDQGFYRRKYPDVARAGADPVRHYLRHGWREGRKPNALFDTGYYLSRDDNLRRSGINPLVHFIVHGVRERRRPHPLFDTDYYLRENLDVAASGINPLAHYLALGGFEGRKPNPDFDGVVYLLGHPEALEAGINPLVHQVEQLERAGVETPPEPKITRRREHQFYDIFRFVTRYRPAALVGPGRALDTASLDIAWVVPVFAAGAGGMMNIVRMIHFLESFGHSVTLYVQVLAHDDHRTASHFASLLHNHFLPVKAAVKILPQDMSTLSGDAIIATDRWTCYPVRSAGNFRRRFYFIQDYEPLFYPMGAEALLAEATYHFGFDAICGGPWLARMAQEKYGMRAVAFEQAADTDCYRILPEATRGSNRIAFYARGATARRAVELGYLAFDVLAERGVDFHVDFFGQEIGTPQLGYSYTCHGVLGATDLGRLYNVATIGMVFSATNYSIIPREMMACGLPVVELDSESSRLSFPDLTAELVQPDPVAIANVLEAMLADPARREAQAARAVRFAGSFSWEASAKTVERALIEGVSLFDASGGPVGGSSAGSSDARAGGGAS